MTKRLLLPLLIALASAPAFGQCCPEKPTAKKQQALWQKLRILVCRRQLDPAK